MTYAAWAGVACRSSSFGQGKRSCCPLNVGVHSEPGRAGAAVSPRWPVPQESLPAMAFMERIKEPASMRPTNRSCSPRRATADAELRDFACEIERWWSRTARAWTRHTPHQVAKHCRCLLASHTQGVLLPAGSRAALLGRHEHLQVSKAEGPRRLGQGANPASKEPWRGLWTGAPSHALGRPYPHEPME